MRPFEDHHPTVAYALVYEMNDALKRAQQAEMMREASAERRKQRRTRYDTPMVTEDAVANEWERAIARGEVPDLDAPATRS